MVLSLRERLDRWEPKGKRYKFGTELTKPGAKLALLPMLDSGGSGKVGIPRR